MKRKIYSIVMSGILLMTLSSCNDWLDVPVDGKFTSDELFATGDGYRSDLNGLYKEMASSTLYGKELQFGLIDFFSNQYNINVGESKLNDPVYIAAGKRDFKNKDLQPVIDAIWLKTFKTIASANDLIKNIRNENNEKFSQGEMEKSMILGEAMAIRAFLHFDMLRLFAPAPIDDDGQIHIPYVTEFPETRAQHLTVKETLSKIIADLEEARKLVKTFDETPLGYSGSAAGVARFYNELQMNMEGNNKLTDLDAFFLGRGYRFSYWAITGLLARAYQYNATYEGADLDKAKAYAEEVLNAKFTGSNAATYYPFKEENFSFTWQDQPEEMTDVRMVGTLVMGLYNELEMKEAGLESLFPREEKGLGNKLFIINRDGQDIFKTVAGEDETTTDIRSTRLIYEPANSYQTFLSTKWYLKKENTKERDRTVTILPLLRTSELRYIIAECDAQKGDFAGAYEILNGMREKRGVQPLQVKTTKDDFLKDLVREGQREWISEGQLFYLYKRLKAGVKRDDGTTKPFTTAESVLPTPIDESK